MGADEVVSFTGTAEHSQRPEKVAAAEAKPVPSMVTTKFGVGLPRPEFVERLVKCRLGRMMNPRL